MNWIIGYLDKAKDDLRGLEGSQQKQVLKTIQKVSQNPLPDYEGGYGKPLGNKSGNNLSGYYKIKILKLINTFNLSTCPAYKWLVY